MLEKVLPVVKVVVPKMIEDGLRRNIKLLGGKVGLQVLPHRLGDLVVPSKSAISIEGCGRRGGGRRGGEAQGLSF
jgi:hypothetical protein